MKISHSTLSPFGADLMATLNAKKLVSDIAKGHGYLADEDLRSLGENRFKVEEALSNAHRMSGLSVITYVTGKLLGSMREH